jgi:hypothetical protein
MDNELQNMFKNSVMAYCDLLLESLAVKNNFMGTKSTLLPTRCLVILLDVCSEFIPDIAATFEF